jgi:uracil-DNA glycosylase
VITAAELDAAATQFLSAMLKECKPADILALGSEVQKLFMNQSNAMAILTLATLLRAMMMESRIVESDARKAIMLAALVKLINPIEEKPDGI